MNCCNRFSKEAEHLNRLVANLLDMTRLEAGALELHKEWQSIEEIVGVALSRMARPLEDHPLDVQIGEELPFVPMDDLLIEQVLVNLLENAAKYSPPGTPIEMPRRRSRRPARRRSRRPRSRIAAGRSESRLRKVLSRHRNGSKAGSRLGLAICRGILELHGGDIVAENRPGGGLLFRLRLPLATSEAGVPPLQVPLDA